MINQERAILVGLMSGTSVDAIDAAVVEITEEEERYRIRLLRHFTMPWPDPVRMEILQACNSEASPARIATLNFRVAEEFARAAILAADAAGLPLTEVAAIASHGQTVWHQPVPVLSAGIETRSTLQIGEPAVIAARTGCRVIADFRCADMAVGGQGAPLVPFADYHLFGDPVETRAVQNLGGIANVTLIPAGGSLADVIAFDTGPGNMIIDALAARVTGNASRFDRNGALASAGSANLELLSTLLGHPYLSLAPPKTTGREEFGVQFAESLYNDAVAHGISEFDLLATVTAFTVESIAQAYRDFLLPRGPIHTVVLGGGGTRNPVLVEGLRDRLSPARIVTHDDFGLPNEAKEAAAFALLGYCTLVGRSSNVPSATGASRPAVLGKIVLPPPA